MKSITALSLPALGALWPEQGGHFAGITLDAAGNSFALIVPPKGVGEFQDLAWVNCADAFTKEGYHWTSTQDDRHHAFVQDFEFGFSDYDYKATQRRVRAVRRSFL